MLLRRITKHVKDQNWFAVSVDFAIVVIGVFIGIQVANWNAARLTSMKEKGFTERLLNELSDEAWIYHYFVSYQEDVLRAAELAQKALEPETNLTREQLLINSYRASQYTWWIQRRGTFDEMIATGNLGLIEKDALRQTALAVYSSPLRKQIEQNGESSPYREMFRRTVPTDVHRALGKACGDMEIPLGEYDRLPDVLSYECKLDLSAEKIEATAQALIANPEFAPTLRLRLATLETELADLKENNEVTRFFEGLRKDGRP